MAFSRGFLSEYRVHEVKLIIPLTTVSYRAWRTFSFFLAMHGALGVHVQSLDSKQSLSILCVFL